MTTVKMVDIDSLTPAKFNPQGRTEERRMKHLLHSMQKHGFVEAFPIIASDKGVIADGHRRWTAAKKLGIEKVPVLYLNGSGMSVDEVWSMNALAQSPTSKEVMEAYLNGMKAVPEKYAKTIQRIEEIAGGKQDLKELFGVNPFSPAVMQRLKTIAAYCEDDSPEFMQKLLHWVIKHKIQHMVWLAVRYKVEKQVILKAIENDRPLAMLIDAA